MKKAVFVRAATACWICRTCTQALYTGLVHTGQALRRCKKVYPKPAGATYRDVKSQNEFLLKVVFYGKGNYVYHRNCIRAAHGVNTQRLARLRKAVQVQSSEPIEYLPKQTVLQCQRRSDVVLPLHCDQATSTWLHSRREDALILFRKQPTRHGKARKQSNHSKSNVF